MGNCVLVVEDDFALCDALCDTLTLAGFEVDSARDGQSALEVIKSGQFNLVISDVQMAGINGLQLLEQIKEDHSELPVMLMTAYGTIQQAVDAMQNGAIDYLVKPFEPEVLVSKVSQLLSSTITSHEGVITVDLATREVFDLARRVAESDATVMVTGESGTGKEVLVQFIHNHSQRKDNPFIAINCAAIPDNMLEAILFGYQKGAYTGAYKSCPGKFEQAQGGTLLLDEISEMNLGLQAKLLRVLQEKEVERLGDNKAISLDVRVIATTNKNLKDEVNNGRFREDLYFRLNVFPITMPALKDRSEDIIPLCEYALASAAREHNVPCPILTDDAKTSLLSYHWPGNVRELENVMQRALILQNNSHINVSQLQFESIPENQTFESSIKYKVEHEDETLGSDLKAREHQVILDALKQCMGSRKTAAEKLGISPRTLRYKLAKMREAGIAIPA